MQQTFLRVRPLVPQAFIVASGLAMSAAGHAQTAYDKLNIGAQVSKGISFSAFAAPLPLPPGEWQVVSTAESKVSLMGGGSDAPGSAKEISVGLKSTDASNPIDLLVATFTPDSVPIVWRSPACNTLGTGAPFKNDFGTVPSGLSYGCAKGFYLSTGNRKFVDTLAHNSNGGVTAQLYSGFTPHLSSISESSVVVSMTFSVDRGRRVSYQIHGRAPSGVLKGNAFDIATQAWTHETGLAIQSALQNKSVAISPFPSAASESGPESIARKLDNAVEITLPGKTLAGSIKLDDAGQALPLPQGQWKVAGRREVQPSTTTGDRASRVYLTLRNMDSNASIAAVWLAYDSKPFYNSQASAKCESKSAPIVESYGTTPESRVASCAMANTYLRSFRERVLNAQTTGTEWDKTNLASLQPYAEGLPDAHTWMELRVGANETRRVLYTFYSAQPPKVSPDGKYLRAVRTWLDRSKDVLDAYLDGKASSFPPYPELVD